MPQQYKISPYSPQNEFGGCDVIIDVLRKEGLRGFIDGNLRKRAARADYEYSEGIFSWLVTLCCGGKRLEQMELNRERLFCHRRFHSLPPRYTEGMSPDTFSKMCDELSRENELFEPLKNDFDPAKLDKQKKRRGRPSKKSIAKIEKLKKTISRHQVCDNFRLNKMLIKAAIKLRLLKKNRQYVLDFDTTIIQNKKQDARRYYLGNGKTGYCPAMASIGDIPIYIENRNGDTPSAWNLKATIHKIVTALREEGIIISIIRIDAAGYNKEFIQYANDNGLKYVTRIKKNSAKEQIEELIDWDIDEMSGMQIELSETTIVKGGYLQRVIVKHDIQNDKYWSLITNINDLSKRQVCELYTIRSGVDGAGEHIFQKLKADFLWDLLPFRTLSKNLVYLILSALCYIIYIFLLRLFRKKLPHLGLRMKLRTFIIKFIKGKTHWQGEELQLDDKIAELYQRLSGFT